MQGDSLPAEPLGKPQNTRVGSLSLLQWNFLPQKLNPGILHCRWILYQLSYRASNSTPNIYPKKTMIPKDTYTPMFIAALFAIARMWKKANCPSIEEWIKKLWYIYTIQYY